MIELDEYQGFLRFFRDTIRVPRFENPVPRIREIGSLQVHTEYLTFSLENLQISQASIHVFEILITNKFF